eukprot:363181-Chlamydomonas_euryale.AAC.17
MLCDLSASRFALTRHERPAWVWCPTRSPASGLAEHLWRSAGQQPASLRAAIERICVLSTPPQKKRFKQPTRPRPADRAPGVRIRIAPAA